MLRSDLRDYSDAYIVVKGRISVEGTVNANKRSKKLTFKKNASFMSWISKINTIFRDSEEDLYIVMSMYNLLEYSANYSMTSGSSWNYYREEVNDAAVEIITNYRVSNNNTTASRSFEYQTKCNREHTC